MNDPLRVHDHLPPSSVGEKKEQLKAHCFGNEWGLALAVEGCNGSLNERKDIVLMFSESLAYCCNSFDKSFASFAPGSIALFSPND